MADDLTTALETNLVLLQQGLDVIDQLGPDRFAHARPGHSSIGAHVRHILDHYQCFLAGLPNGRVDYDARERDAATELQAARAQARLAATIDALDSLGTDAMPPAIEVNASSGAHGDRPAAWTRSTPTRELGFLQSHTVHHYALIKLLAELEGVALDPAFGVAPATIAWRGGRG